MNIRYFSLASACFLITVVTLVYWPGRLGPYLLDDLSNVTALPPSSGNLISDAKNAFGNTSGPLGRPLAVLTFIVERYFLGNTAEVGKRTNIIFHGFNSFLVYIFLSLLLRHDNARARFWLSLGGASVWALSPLQVSTVLYAVQRMAILSAGFMLLALCLFVLARRRYVQGEASFGYVIGVVLCFLLAIFSKENAIVLVVLIPLIELIYLQSPHEDRERSRHLKRYALIALCSALTVGALMLLIYWPTVLSAYESRHFSMSERLMTQARVLWHLVRQFFSPDVRIMGLFHDDIEVSKNFFQPVSTLWGASAWAMVLLLACLFLFFGIAKTFSLGVFFFLLSHSVESTVLPLELYFEHRNYFPSVGLTLLIVAVARQILLFSLRATIPVAVGLMSCALYFAFLTSSQVNVWSDRQLLVLNDVAFHPNSPRANMSMAVLLAANGQYPTSLDYLKRARLNDRTLDEIVYRLRAIALACLANEPFDSESFGSSQPSSNLDSDEVETAIAAIVSRVQMNECPNLNVMLFADQLDRLLGDSQAVNERKFRLLYMAAMLENSLGRVDKALSHVREAVSINEDPELLLMQLHLEMLRRDSRYSKTLSLLNSLDRSGSLTGKQKAALREYEDRRR